MANLYENENYAVVVTLVGDDRKYSVVNKATLVVEHTTQQMPEAFVAAASLNRAIKDKVWEYASGEKEDPMMAELRAMGIAPVGGGSVPPAGNDTTFN